MREDFLAQKLHQRATEGILRRLEYRPELVDFVSNDYLGLARSKALFERIMHKMEGSYLANGATGSRLLSGNHPAYEELELFLAGLFSAEACLVFHSGYAANQALVSSVADKGDTVLYDQLAHVCLKEGAWLSKAETAAFRHNDLEDLEARLKRAKGRKFVVTESIFSMDGDRAPLSELVELCESFEAYLIVDEAHSTGVYGAEGAGLLKELDLAKRTFAKVYTFGKAMGVHGACVAGSNTLVQYLINFGRPFIYTTALPPHSVVSILESFRYLHGQPELQEALAVRIALFRNAFSPAISETAIQPVLVGSAEKARQAAQRLRELGYEVRPILSPTVQKGTERLRICLHTFNTNEEIEGLAHALLNTLG